MESDLMRKIQIKLSTVGARVFRNNVAEGWVGKFVLRAKGGENITLQPGDVVIRNARVLHAGLIVGSSDLIGFNKSGRFLAVEVKELMGKPTPEQQSFINVVNASGGIAFIARSVDEAVQLLENADGK